jgi:hypothetical protein
MAEPTAIRDLSRSAGRTVPAIRRAVPAPSGGTSSQPRPRIERTRAFLDAPFTHPVNVRLTHPWHHGPLFWSMRSWESVRRQNGLGHADSQGRTDHQGKHGRQWLTKGEAGAVQDVFCTLLRPCPPVIAILPAPGDSGPITPDGTRPSPTALKVPSLIHRPAEAAGARAEEGLCR